MSKIRARQRKIAIRRKQKRKGKLRRLMQKYAVTTGKVERERILAKVRTISPYFTIDEKKA